MKRLVIAFIVSPILVGGIFGVYAIGALSVMLPITLLVAVPLFLMLRKIHCLEWWHSLIAGIVCGAALPLVGMATRPTPDIDWLVTSNNLLYVGLGALVSQIFWWVGIFRNAAIPFVSHELPKAMLLLIPLIVGGDWAFKELRIKYYEGRVLSVLEEASPSTGKGHVAVRLKDGIVVDAIPADAWPGSVSVGTCVFLVNRWSASRLRRIYEAFGGGSHDC